MITNYIVGDIRETELSYIAHGVNCQNKMGSGVAKSLYEKWEDVKIKYHRYCDNVPITKRLSTVEPVKCGDKPSTIVLPSITMAMTVKNT